MYNNNTILYFFFWCFMNEYSYISLGCSHSRVKYLEEQKTWPFIVKQSTNKLFSYIHTCKIATGLVHLEKRCQEIIGNLSINTKCVILQKPQSIRFPWWDPKWKENISPRRYSDSLDLVQGRKYSIKKYSKLNRKRKKSVADFILQEEFNILRIIRDFFINADIYYYHYWGDYVIDYLHRPYLAENNIKLGELAESIGINNWKMIINIKDVEGITDSTGQFDINHKTLLDNGWIYGGRDGKDLHPQYKFQQEVAQKVIQHIC